MCEAIWLAIGRRMGWVKRLQHKTASDATVHVSVEGAEEAMATLDRFAEKAWKVAGVVEKLNADCDKLAKAAGQ